MLHRTRLLLVTVTLVCLLQLPAFSQDAFTLKQRTAARAATIASLLSARIVREGPSGFLVVVATQVSDQQRQLITDENRDRSAIFQIVASQSGETAGQVAALYAQRAQKLNAPDVTTSSSSMAASTPPLPSIVPDSCGDKQMAADLQDRFGRDEDLKGEGIQVDVAKKTVILSGTVSSALARTYAEDLVGKCVCQAGSIVNNLKIDSDKMIASRIQQSFTKDSTLRAQHIQVDVSRGNVVLSGVVPENLIRTVAASTADKVRGVTTVTNNIRVQPNASSTHESDLPPNHDSLPRATLTGTWVGSYVSCAQGRTDISMRITESAPDDITVSAELAMPNSSPGTFTSHGILNTLNSFLSLQFGGWQHQPPGLAVGDIGGYVTYVNQRPAEFSGILRQPGCGQISLKKK